MPLSARSNATGRYRHMSTPIVHSPADCILVADDLPENVRLLQTLLVRSEYQNVHTTTDPRKVRAMYDEVNPDIVLLDLHMPGEDGLTVMRDLRTANEGRTFLPIVILTGDM